MVRPPEAGHGRRRRQKTLQQWLLNGQVKCLLILMHYYLVSLHGLLQVKHGGEYLGELFLDDAEPVLKDGG